MKPEIALVYDADCPNVPKARAALREALELSGLAPRWIEYDRAAAGVPERLLGCGSPTILVDGVDVAGEASGAAACCRVYQSASGLRGAPAVEAIVAAIELARSVVAVEKLPGPPVSKLRGRVERSECGAKLKPLR